MIDISYKGDTLVLVNSDKKEISFHPETHEVLLEGFDVNYPGEYEKAGILLEVKEFASKLFYHFVVEGNHLVIIPTEGFEAKEEILSFFGDVDILLINGSKESAKLFESIEAKIAVPFGEGKDLFLNTLGQHVEESNGYKVKAELPIDNTEFVNLV
jgi:hypothetical protein